MLPTPLLSRMLIIDIAPPSVDDWKDWMDATYGEDGWARTTYVFLKRFEAENYLIQVPRTPEGLDAYPVPRTWTALATLMANNMSDSETIKGLVGEEVGIKFGAFLKVDVDLNELMREPERFVELGEDARYMTALMLSSWIGDHMKKPDRAFPLIDVMSGVIPVAVAEVEEQDEEAIPEDEEAIPEAYMTQRGGSREYLLLTCLTISRRKLVLFLKALFIHDAQYKDMLSEVALKIRDEIAV